jgi:hypothetical protein
MDTTLSKNVKRLGRLDLPGAGQVRVEGNYAYVGHLPNRAQLGTSILDVSDPRKPRVVSQIHLEDPRSHSHKARVVGDLMFVNGEQNGPNRQQADLQADAGAYDGGGFRIYDVSDRTRPKLVHFERTGGRGVHRFDVDARYAYISTEMAGYVGNILVIYDLRDPARPEEVSRWWLPGQHVSGGEKPQWPGRRNRLHHALRFGAPVGRLPARRLRVIDISDIRAPRTVGEYNYHPPFPEPSHTFMPVPFDVGGRSIALAIDEEDHAHSAAEMERRRGRPHACLWVLDVTNLKKIEPLSLFEVSELDSPWSRAAPGRFGAHQFQEHMKYAPVLHLVLGLPASSTSPTRSRRAKSATSSRSRLGQAAP